MALIKDAIDVCFGSPCKCAIRIPEEVSPKMIGNLPDSFKLIAATSELLKEEVTMLHETGQIIHIYANELIMSATILHPNIWIGFQGYNPMYMSVYAKCSCHLAPLVQSPERALMIMSKHPWQSPNSGPAMMYSISVVKAMR
jgi:hypothetical protein